MTDVVTMGTTIRELRTRAFLTQAELASQAGVALRALQRLETGIGNPTLQTLIAIASALNTDVTQLMPVDRSANDPQQGEEVLLLLRAWFAASPSEREQVINILSGSN